MNTLATQTGATAAAQPVAKRASWQAWTIVLLLVIWAGLPMVASRHAVDLMVFAGIYSIAGLGVALLLGQCGVLNLGQAVFYGAGAYATAVATVQLGIGSLAGLALGVGVSVALAVAIGWPILRLSGFFLGLATLAFCVAGGALFHEWYWLTGGELGIGGIPKIAFAGVALDTPTSFYYFIWPLVAVIFVLASNLVNGRTGLAMRAMRDAPVAAEVLAIDMHRIRVFMFALSAALGAVAGSLFAHYASFVSVASFNIERSILFLLIPVIAGPRSVWGVLAGAIFMTFVPEWLTVVGDFHRVLFGVALVLVVTLLPDGIVGELVKRYTRSKHASAG